MSYSNRGVARPNTVVVKILDLKRDWVKAVPDTKQREAACIREGVKWSSFTAWCAPSNSVNGRANLSIDMYFKYIQASGLDPDKYEDKDANPNDYIVHRSYKKKSTTSKVPTDKTTTAKVTTGSPKNTSITPESKTSSTSANTKNSNPTIVIFEKPGKSSRKQSVSGGVGNKSAVKGSSKISDKSTSTTGYIRTIKHDDVPNRKKADNSAAYVTFNKKMKSFSTHLSIYLCTLHLSADNVIFSTSITDFRDIRDGRKELQFYDYIILSDYLVRAYENCSDISAKKAFDQIANLFGDIYVKTLYYGADT
jgi:hypothetical protein